MINDDNLIDKLYENILVYKIYTKPLRKPWRISFDKIDVFIRFYHGTRYLVLFGSEKYGFI